jgi:competence protein ComEA
MKSVIETVFGVPVSLLKSLMFALALVMAATAPQAYGAGSEPAIQAEPIVNINTASAAELAESLSGVGLKRAEDIVAWRERHGPFKSADELGNVKGVGSATIEKNRTRIRL